MKIDKQLLLTNQYVLITITFVYLLIALGISAIYAVQVNRYVSKELNAKLTFNVNAKQQKIKSWLKNYRSDVTFMANLPAVKGYISASSQGGVDKKYGNSVALYQSFVNDVFASFMVSKPDIIKTRIIGLTNNGRELIRYNRINKQVIKVPELALQEKDQRNFFKAITPLKGNEIYVSDIELNQDHGRLSNPHQPTIRLGTPLFEDDGKLFAMLVINYDANFIFNDVTKEAFDDDQIQTLLLNSDGDYLIHPEPAKTFGFDLGKRYVWTEDFKVSTHNIVTATHALSWLTAGEKSFFVARDIALDANNPNRKLTVISLLSTKVSLHDSLSAGFYLFITLMGLGLLIALVFYRARTNEFIKNEQIKNQARLDVEVQARQMIEYSAYAQALLNQQGLIEMVNLQFEKIFGYTRQEIIGKPIEILIPERYYQKHLNFLNHFLKRPTSLQAAATLSLFTLNKNSKEIAVDIGLARIETSHEVKILVSIVDVTERNAREEALRKTARDLERTGFLAHVGGIELDLVTSLVTLSKEASAIHGFLNDGEKAFDEVINLYDSESQQLIREAIDHVLKHGDGWDLELKLTKVNGQKAWVRTQGFAEYQNGKPTHLVGAVHEITNLKNSIEELNYRNKELNNFAYIASHDLKSPLRGLDQIASWLEEDLTESMAEQTKVYLRLMRSRIKRMEQLLSDLLAYARAGNVYGEPEMVNLAAMAQDVFNLCCYENNFSLKLVGDFPNFVTAKTPLETIFRNLIGNAIKHHDQNQGEIVVSANAKGNFYQFEVADNGPGIPAEYSDRAFGMFQTLRPRDEIEGSGMGLAIVKKTIESLGGKITLKVNEPRGAVFSFTWPQVINPKL